MLRIRGGTGGRDFSGGAWGERIGKVGSYIPMRQDFQKRISDAGSSYYYKLEGGASEHHPGQVMDIFLVSNPSLAGLERFLPDASILGSAGILENGNLRPSETTGNSARAPRVYYGHIEYAGAAEPLTGKPGLGLLPGIVVYNGRFRSFLEAFRHFSESRNLQDKMGLYLEPDTYLTWDSQGYEVGGMGGLCLWYRSPGASGADGFRIFQYASGERFSKDVPPSPGDASGAPISG
jgi:hypothetical protein